MKHNKLVTYQYRYIKKTGELILVYVNYRKNTNIRWYEIYIPYSGEHSEVTKEFLLKETIPSNRGEHAEFTNILLRYGKLEPNSEIINRLPKL
jgi:hypothetical protein